MVAVIFKITKKHKYLEAYIIWALYFDRPTFKDKTYWKSWHLQYIQYILEINTPLEQVRIILTKVAGCLHRYKRFVYACVYACIHL